MKNFKACLSIGLVSLIFCLALFISLFIPVSIVNAAEIQGTDDVYYFEFHCGINSGNPLYIDTLYKLKFNGNNIDFVTVCVGEELHIMALSFEPFTYDYFKYLVSPDGQPHLNSGSDWIKSNTINYNGETIYYSHINITAYSMDDVYGLPNFKYRESFDINSIYEEFVTNGGIDWHEDFLYPDKDDLFPQAGKILLDVDAFISDNILTVTWSGLDGAVPSASKYSFVSVELLINDKDTDKRTNAPWLNNFWVSDGGFERSLDSSILHDNEYLYGIWLTPYYYEDDNDINSLQRGIKTEIYFDKDGNWDEEKNGPSHGGGGHGHDSNTYELDDFYLTGVKLSKDLIGYYTVSWTGTTYTTELIYTPESDTAVIAVALFQDEDREITYKEVGKTTINKGYLSFDVEELLDIDQKEPYYWIDSSVYLYPTFTKDGDLYMGQATVVNCLTGDVTDDNKGENNTPSGNDPGIGGDYYFDFDISSMLEYATIAFSFLNSLIQTMRDFPNMVAAVFQFIPDIYIKAIGMMLIIIFIARILGR